VRDRCSLGAPIRTATGSSSASGPSAFSSDQGIPQIKAATSKGTRFAAGRKGICCGTGSARIESAGLALIWLADLVRAGPCRRGTHRAWLFARVPGLRRRGDPPHASAEPWTSDGRLHRFRPMLGLVAGKSGLGAVYLVSALIVLCSIAVAVRLLAPSVGRRNECGDEASARRPRRKYQ
jgi:hypothetical protein